VDDLCIALFQKEDVRNVLSRYGDLNKYPLNDFVIATTVSKNPNRYEKTTMYAKLIRQFAKHNIAVRWGDKVRYVKTTEGYKPVFLFSDDDQLDFDYYKERLAQVYCRIMFEKLTAKLKRSLMSMMSNKARLEKWT